MSRYADGQVEWSDEMKELIAWFDSAEIPGDPFYLHEHSFVYTPDLFFKSLQREIIAGPNGPRGINGALEADLKSLRVALAKEPDDVNSIDG